MKDILFIIAAFLLLLLLAGCETAADGSKRPASWLAVKACYALPDGTQVCGGVAGGNVEFSAVAGLKK